MRVSLHGRLMATTAIALGLFLLATGWIWERLFTTSVRASAEEQMLIVAYGLVDATRKHADPGDFRGTYRSATQPTGEGPDDRAGPQAQAPVVDPPILLPDELGEPRLSRPNSGLYAYIEMADGTLAWRSPSMTITSVAAAPNPRPPPGDSRFHKIERGGTEPRFLLGYTVILEELEDSELTFWVLNDQSPFNAEIREFRRSLVVGVTAATLLLIVLQLGTLRWGLRPLRRMAERVRALHAGQRGDIGEDYPAELAQLAHTLNRFVEHELENRERYRRAMGDLAHSLKTPLAVLKNALITPDRPDKTLFDDQLDRMEATISRQLSRAAAIPTVLPHEPVAVKPLLERLCRALDKAYAEKGVDVEIRAAEVRVRADERDVMDVLGNLLENAYKYSHSKVRVTARQDKCPATPASVGRTSGPNATEQNALRTGSEAREVLCVVIEDDGDGIPEAAKRYVFERGARADTAHSGHGIGLAAAVELATAYGGTVQLADSDLGGARVILKLPA